MLALDDVRAEFVRAGVPTIDDDPFLAFCPVCYGEVTVASDRDTVSITCSGEGCSRPRIADKLHFMAAEREGVAGGAPPSGCHPATPLEFGSTGGLVGVAPPATPATLRRVDVEDMLGREPDPIDWIVEGVVARGTLTLLAGREKEGKSLLLMALAAAAASGGGTLAGLDVGRSKVLVIDAENGERELHRRLRSLGLKAPHASLIDVYEAGGHDLRRHLDELAALLDLHQPDLVLLDSWRSLWGGDENDAGEVARVLDPLRNLIRRHNCGAVLIHHMKKGGGYRGSSAIGASVENVIELARMDEDPDRRRRRLRNVACRYEQEADDRWLRIEADRARGLLLIDEAEPFKSSSPQRADVGERLLDVLSGTQSSWAAWARSADLDPKDRTARRARDELVARGLAQSIGDGWVRSLGAVA